MNRAAWNQPVDAATAARRAGGRARINSRRIAERAARQWRAVKLWREGWKSREIAAQLGVHPITAARYTRAARRLAAEREINRLTASLFRHLRGGGE